MMHHHYEQYQYHLRMAEMYKHAYDHHMGLARYHYAMWQSLLSGKSPLPIHDELSAIITERRIEKPGVDIIYPYVEGLSDVGVQYKINRTLVGKIHQMIREQYQDTPTAKITLTGRYAIKLNQCDLLSVYLDQHSHTEGSEHGLTIAGSLTFTLSDGQCYKLTDLLMGGEEPTALLNDIIRRQIEDKEIPLISEFESIRSDQEYYLTEDALILYFQPYEHTPYVYGVPQFILPYKTIEEILNPSGPVQRLTAGA